MKTRQSRVFCCDFETTVFPGQISTEVWAAACVEMFTDDVKIYHSIEEQFNYFRSLKSNIIAYYHNLKFDGAFWLSYLMVDLEYEQAAVKRSTGAADFQPEDEADDFAFIEPWNMKAKTFQYSVGDLGQWYKILVKLDKDHYLEIRDSLKLLPFSIASIGKAFKTEHQKLEMEYTGFRYAGCEITADERKYIANDVLVLKEAMEVMYTQGNRKITIGSCCLTEWQKTMTKSQYQEYFPNLYQYRINKEIFGSDTIGAYIRKAYRGGWCYVVRGKEKKIYHNGTTADVNSLYPSMMHSESGNFYPIGVPVFWRGDAIPNEALAPDRYYFVRIRTRFYLKKGKLPFIQLKGNLMYQANKCLETSDIEDERITKTGKRKIERYKFYEDFDGSTKPAAVEMTLTCTDFRLILEHYDLKEMEILDGCHFATATGFFDEYINKYRKMKEENTGALRTLAKLYLNSLYGKTAASPDNNFKVAYVKEDKSIGFYSVKASREIKDAKIPPQTKEPGYIPVGAAITSYARNFTIRAAQANYYGPDKPGFIYADTDSIHCDLLPDQIKGIKVDPVKFCHWKLESCWDTGYFARQKTYMEHVVAEDMKPLPEDKQYYSVKCAGMPERCKDLFLLSMGEKTEVKDITFEELKFAVKDRDIENFDVGLVVPGKLLPKRIRGGILLIDSLYEMR